MRSRFKDVFAESAIVVLKRFNIRPIKFRRLFVCLSRTRKNQNTPLRNVCIYKQVR